MEEHGAQQPMPPESQGRYVLQDLKFIATVGERAVMLDEERLYEIIKTGTASGMWRFYWQALLVTVGVIILLQIFFGLAGG